MLAAPTLGEHEYAVYACSVDPIYGRDYLVASNSVGQSSQQRGVVKKVNNIWGKVVNSIGSKTVISSKADNSVGAMY